MVREIKFEAWDAENQKMVGPYTVGSELSMAWGAGDRQYTGLKARHGTEEVYEEDIVQHNENKYRIVWSDVVLGFVGERTERKENWRDGRWLIKCMKHCKVVGNTFENPELFND